MKIETKFDLGQEVWAVSEGYIKRDEPCGTCVPAGNAGQIVINGETFRCPKCNGTGKDQRGKRSAYIQCRSRVGRVQAEISMHDNGHAITPKLRVSYMLIATGVGSGTVWRERALFGSHAEAEAECSRINACFDSYQDPFPGDDE